MADLTLDYQLADGIANVPDEYPCLGSSNAGLPEKK